MQGLQKLKCKRTWLLETPELRSGVHNLGGPGKRLLAGFFQGLISSLIGRLTNIIIEHAKSDAGASVFSRLSRRQGIGLRAELPEGPGQQTGELRPECP